MTQFRKFNLITGWTVFAVATVTYALTIEPTASLWDCGEFIASAYKLEVGHPPGAPLFMIIAKVFSLLSFGNTAKVAQLMNMLSGLSSAFTILFLFWTITHIAKKMVRKVANTETFNLSQLIVIMGSGAVGALAYTFSDTFWFSAVEAEVYAMSSLFTAMVFWAILRWEDVAHEKYADRWIILIAFLMGLSIGVHLLNLLAIPAIALVYYFKKYKTTALGVIVTVLSSFVLLVLIMYGIIQGLVVFASWFERIFVNNFGMPINLGFLIFVILLFAVVGAGLFFSYKYQKPLLNTIILSFTVILIGYSSFAMIIIRSSANPPMDENNPEHAFALKSYLNREQYGDRPLFKGQLYDAEVNERVDKYTYIRFGDKYKKVKKTNPTYKYDKNIFFPRMYSSEDSHISAYKSWGAVRNSPNIANNILFFVKYQIGHMYFRYFMWNFAGRQNDEQGHGGYQKGNWISGINFLDAARLGKQNILPDDLKNNPSRNVYFMLPLLLGLLGVIFNFSKGQKDFWVVSALFLLTGLAIVVYLNQTPYQPRERDYAYAGSFYAFAIWIGLGVLALWDMISKIKQLKNPIAHAAIAVAVALIIPIQMASQNWDDHDRSGRYTTRDLAANYLNSCAPNAILFTYGDNDTFPLWYAQEVEGIRTDVRVVNLSLLSTDWYTEQMTRKAYTSERLPISFKFEQYRQGNRDFVPVYDSEETRDFLFMEKYNANKKKFDERYKTMFNYFIETAKNSSFPEMEKKMMNTLNNGYEKFSVAQFINLINTISDNKNVVKFNFNPTSIDSLKKETAVLRKEIGESPVALVDLIKFIGSDQPETKVGYVDEQVNFIPTTFFKLPVDKKKVIELGIVPKDKENEIVDALEWRIGKSYLMKSQMIILDILAHNNWERPVYFASSVGADNYMGLTKYFRLEGFAYRVVPYEVKGNDKGVFGSVDSEILYNNLMSFEWGNLSGENFYADSYVKRVVSIMDIRDVFHRLAEKLIEENQNEKAEEVLDKCIAEIPQDKIPYSFSILPIVEDYYKIGKFEKGNALAIAIFEYHKEHLEYYVQLKGDQANDVDREKQIAVYVMQQLLAYAQEHEQNEIMEKIMPTFQNNAYILGM